jgi:hypothetical protein
MMNLEVWKKNREEMMREAEQNRLAEVLRNSRKRRGASQVSALAWELRRASGRLRKLLRSLKRAD